MALGLVDALTREVGSVGVFRPLYEPTAGTDLVLDLLISQPGIQQGYADALGVGYDTAHDDPDEALATIVERFGRLSGTYDVVVVLGSDYTDISTGSELAFNASIAANLGSPVVLVVHGRDRTPPRSGQRRRPRSLSCRLITRGRWR